MLIVKKTMLPIFIFVTTQISSAYGEGVETGIVEATLKTQQSAATVPEQSTSYEPMKVFTRFAGKTMRGSWAGENGETVVDMSYGEMILNGRAYQGTHKINNSTYGGRTIIFYDEGAQEYIFHYFTTAGFHTTGKIELEDNGYSGFEKVKGHPTIAAVKSVLEIEGERQLVRVQYQTHDGTWTEEPVRVYKPYNGPIPFAKQD